MARISGSIIIPRDFIAPETEPTTQLDVDFNDNLLKELLTKTKLNKTQTKILIDNFNYVQAYPNPRTTRKEFLISILWKKYWIDMKKRKAESKKISDKWINDIEEILKSH